MSLWCTVHLQLSSIHSVLSIRFFFLVHYSCLVALHNVLNENHILPWHPILAHNFSSPSGRGRLWKKWKLEKMEKTKDHRIASHRSSCIFFSILRCDWLVFCVASFNVNLYRVAGNSIYQPIDCLTLLSWIKSYTHTMPRKLFPVQSNMFFGLETLNDVVWFNEIFCRLNATTNELLENCHQIVYHYDAYSDFVFPFFLSTKCSNNCLSLWPWATKFPVALRI